LTLYFDHDGDPESATERVLARCLLCIKFSMGRTDDSSEEGRKSERKRKSSKKHKRRKEEKKRHRRSPSSGDDSYKERKRRKKEHKKDKKKEKKHKHEERNNDSTDSALDRNYALADSLCSLLDDHPPLAADLPIMLIRLAGGAAFNLSQMTDSSAAHGLSKVFACLEPFGVRVDANGAWTWKGPGGSTNNELVLIRVVRALLDQIGVTVDAVEAEENRKEAIAVPESKPEPAVVQQDFKDSVQEKTKSLLSTFKGGELGKELAGLCQMILDGESIALDSLPDKRLRGALESLFEICGLEKSEMDEESDDDENEGPTMGYALPESHVEIARSSLSTVLKVCESNTKEAAQARRPIKGPMMPEDYAQYQQLQVDSESDDDEGPALPGAQVRGPTLPEEIVKAKVAQRARQLQNVKVGIDPNEGQHDGAAREEWMLDPGKFDLFASVKSGQPLRNRQFAAKSKQTPEEAEKPVDPAVKAEMAAIMQAHHDSRGLSLMDEHRKLQEEKQKESEGKKSWKWNRDKDLDAGRRVDKNALGMIFGGAADDLKKKFQGSFGGR